MAKKFFARHFTLRNLSPLHDTPVVFAVSQWQFDKSRADILYAIYRILVLAFFITTWCMSFETNYLIYFTNWGYTLCTFKMLLAFILQFSFLLSTRVFKSASALEHVLKLYPLYWAIHMAALSGGIVITIIYWSVLYTSEIPFTATNFFVHGSNSIMLVIDLLVVGHPIRLLHFIYPVLLGIAYVIFSVAYYFYDTNRGGVGYVYHILDWAAPLSATLTVLGIILLAIFVHLFVFGVHTIKVMVHRKMYPQIIQPTGNPTQSTEQLSGVV